MSKPDKLSTSLFGVEPVVPSIVHPHESQAHLRATRLANTTLVVVVAMVVMVVVCTRACLWLGHNDQRTTLWSLFPQSTSTWMIHRNKTQEVRLIWQVPLLAETPHQPTKSIYKKRSMKLQYICPFLNLWENNGLNTRVMRTW